MTEREAGPEIDAEIAEKVLGIRTTRADDGTPLQFYGDYPNGFYALPKPYSTDIGAAWRVFERLLALGYYPDIVTTATATGAEYRCDVDRYSDDEATVAPWPIRRVATSAPLAICRAAIASLSLSEDRE